MSLGISRRALRVLAAHAGTAQLAFEAGYRHGMRVRWLNTARDRDTTGGARHQCVEFAREYHRDYLRALADLSGRDRNGEMARRVARKAMDERDRARAIVARYLREAAS